MQGPRIWFDVSYTRTQTVSIGITRTVRRMFDALREHQGNCSAVAWHRDGFRQVEFPSPPVARTAAPADGDRGQRLFQAVTGSVARRLVLLALKLVPWSVLRRPWHFAAAKTFDALSDTLPPAAFAPGDVLVLADISWNYPVWTAVDAARRAGAKLVLVVYDMMPVRRPDFVFGLVPHVFDTCLRELLPRCDAVMCISRATQDDLQAWASEQDLALPATGWFHLGADAVVAARGAVRADIEAFLCQGPPCFVAVGSFEPKKNYPALVRAFEQLWARGVQARLLLLGKETQDCAAFSEALRIHPQQGRLLLSVHDASDAEVASAYTRGKALVFPSLFEGFGLPLVEARARGCRVIASRIPAFVELADAGVTLFEPDSVDAMAAAILQALAEGARPSPASRALTWSECALRFDQRVRELVAQGGMQPT